MGGREGENSKKNGKNAKLTEYHKQILFLLTNKFGVDMAMERGGDGYPTN